MDKLQDKIDEMTKIPSTYKQFGFTPKSRKPEDYGFGGTTKLPKIIRQPNRDWRPFVPTYEPQYNDQTDTNGCTIWGWLNLIETDIKQATGLEYNYSERFNHIVAFMRGAITRQGAWPTDIAQVIREYFVIPDELLPFTKNMTYEEYLTPRPIPEKLTNEAKKFPYEFRYEWVWSSPIAEAERTKRIREYLQYGPIGVSVTAWIEKDGVFVDEGLPSSHWCLLVAEEAGKGWWVFDSYDQYLKIVSYDHDMYCGARGMLIPKDNPNTPENETASFFQKILDFLKETLKAIVNNAPVEEKHVDKPVDKRPDLVAPFCLAIQKHEGWYVGSRSYRNNNPGNLKYAGQWKATGKDAQGFAIFPDYNTGFKALQDMCINAFTGKSKVYNKNDTIYQFFTQYAPSSDNNDPKAYAEAVAKELQISPDEIISNLIGT